MKAKDCEYFDTCNAQLCPSDKESLEKCSWFPDENICKKFKSPKWIKTQKKIKETDSNPDRYFTYEMLKNIKNVHKSIKGLDPDKEEKEQLQSWYDTRKISQNYSA